MCVQYFDPEGTRLWNLVLLAIVEWFAPGIAVIVCYGGDSNESSDVVRELTTCPVVNGGPHPDALGLRKVGGMLSG